MTKDKKISCSKDLPDQPISGWERLSTSGAAAAGAVADDVTLMAAPLSDSSGNEISSGELQQMLGAVSEPTIGTLQNMSTIGMGGIGTVFSAHDPVLHREIAIKILRPAYRNQLNYVTSFIREARITAQIDHPNVIPVHRLGVFDDAGAYFTMKRVRGVTLAHILRKLKDGDEELVKTYTRQRLLEIFISICNGVAFAHSKGIIHRDLKPGNIMVGDYGEVFIADWGLAIYREEDDSSLSSNKIKLGHLPEDSPAVPQDEKSKNISGTPAFMAPEQIVGGDKDLDAQTDVYALGTILYSILTWEQSPYEGISTVSQLVQKIVQQRFLRPRRRAPRRRIPYELEAITLKAMHHDKQQRYASAIALLSDVRNYMAKYPVSAYSPQPLYRLYKLIRRRPLVPLTLLVALLTLGIWNASNRIHSLLEAKSMISVLHTTLEDFEGAVGRAITSREKLNEFYSATGKTETHGNALASRSRFLRSANELTLAGDNAWETLQYLQQLGVDKKIIVPLFNRLFSGYSRFALASADRQALRKMVGRIQQLPEEISREILQKNPQLARLVRQMHTDQGELLIEGSKDIILSAVRKMDRSGEIPGNAPDNGDVLLQLQSNGQSNLLDSGSYAVSAQLPEGRVLHFPVQVEQNHQTHIQLKLPERWPEGMVYVPGGEFIFGERTFDEQFARISLEPYFISKHEVTIGEYLKFWQQLDGNLRERYRAYVDDTANGGRKLMPLWDENGQINVPYNDRMPVIGVVAEAAEEYCRFMTRQTGITHRLPTALEWEKAARGVDGREFVWGNVFHNDYACINKLDQATPGNTPVEVGSYPKDCSVYGVMDLTGNARELVINPGSWQYYTAKGSSFNLSQRFARLAAHAYASNLSDVGFRCVVPVK